MPCPCSAVLALDSPLSIAMLGQHPFCMWETIGGIHVVAWRETGRILLDTVRPCMRVVLLRFASLGLGLGWLFVSWFLGTYLRDECVHEVEHGYMYRTAPHRMHCLVYNTRCHAQSAVVYATPTKHCKAKRNLTTQSRSTAPRSGSQRLHPESGVHHSHPRSRCV